MESREHRYADCGSSSMFCISDAHFDHNMDRHETRDDHVASGTPGGLLSLQHSFEQFVKSLVIVLPDKNLAKIDWTAY